VNLAELYLYGNPITDSEARKIRGSLRGRDKKIYWSSNLWEPSLWP